MFTCFLEVTLMRGICNSTTLHQRKIKFQIFTSENFVLSGRMCSDLFYPLLAGINYNVYYVEARLRNQNNASPTVINGVLSQLQRRCDNYYFASSYKQQYKRTMLNTVSAVKFANNFSHWSTWKLRYQMVKKDADIGITDADSHY